MTAKLRAVDVSVEARVNRVSLELEPRSVTTVIGANGSGKSSLLQVLAGELQADAGNVFVDGTSITSYSQRELARVRAILDQYTQVHFGFRVRDVVSWGRTPWHGTEQARMDVEIIERCMSDQRIDHLAQRPVAELSGGERKRVHIARVLAQATPVLMLDEADGDLDLPGRAHLDHVVRDLATKGVTVVVVSHDLARAARHSDRIVAMQRGSVVATGSPDQIMSSTMLTEVFETPCTVERTPSGHLMIATS